MTVKLVKTLGASPLVLLEKLAAAGGCTLVQDKKVTDNDSVVYTYKVVAKIFDNLYIEVQDNILNALNTNNKAIPWLYNDAGSDTAKLGTQIADDTMKGLSVAYRSFVLLGKYADKVPNTVISGSIPLSILVTLPPTNNNNTACGFNFKQSQSMAASKIVVCGSLPSTDSVVVNGGNGFKLVGTTRATADYTPFGILNAPLASYSIDTGNFPSSFSGQPANRMMPIYNDTDRSAVLPYPIIVSSCKFRIGASVDTSGELVNPTSWNDLPIFTDIMSDGAGLYFSVPSSTGQFLVISTVDTSKGNKLSGTFPVAYRNTPYAYNPNTVAETQLKVIGDATAATTEIAMNEYVPTLPIANDSVTGGPVVTNIFAVGTDEIRGIVPGVLGCSSNLAIGTIGWLDGIKYKVSRPGRMIKIG